MLRENAAGGGTARILSGPLRSYTISTPFAMPMAMMLGRYETHIVHEFSTYLQKGETAFDVGANVGYLSMCLAKITGESGRVVAFEPDPVNSKYLQQNCDSSSFPNVTCVPKAVCERPGSIRFATYGYSLVNHVVTDVPPATDAAVLDVQSVSLDSYVFDEHNSPPALIKIDVEASELAVFQGAEQLLWEARPIVIAEVRSDQLNSIQKLTRKVGYRDRVLQGGWQLDSDLLCDVLFLPQ